MHTNDRQIKADKLGLTVEEFDRLLASANHAYKVLTDLGPFYGKGDSKEPTFRVTAEPVYLPRGSKKVLHKLGEDLLALGRALPKLPSKYKLLLGEDLVFTIPPAWRIDVILSEVGHLHINEIEGDDDASALMMGEQMAYGLQSFEDSTAAHLIETYEKMYPGKSEIKIALIRPSMKKDLPVSANMKKFNEFLHKLSHGRIQVTVYYDQELINGKEKPAWNRFDGVINESTILPSELQKLGIDRDRLIASASYNTIMNKGVFALIFDTKLHSFWKKEIGEAALERLQELMPMTRFIKTKEDFDKARSEGKVLKVSWAGSNIALIDRSQGVAMPGHGRAFEQASEERWSSLKKLATKGYRIVAQEYIPPTRLTAYLRKKATNLEKVEWYNRICVKYVADGDPNDPVTRHVSLTGVEVTLGPNLIPAGRACAFTAGRFEEDEEIDTHERSSTRHFLQIPKE